MMSFHCLRPYRGAVLTVALILFSAGAVWGQPAASALGSTETELAKWAVTQGGLLVMALIVVWSYRRDFARALINEKERADHMIVLVERTTAALVTHTEATRVHTEGLSQLTESVKTCQLVQTLLHTRVEG